jgi:UDP-glucose 4-epimerase
MRLTNTYGPRLAVNVPGQGVLSGFFMRLLLGLPLEIFGDGEQLRDPVYVDDAVDALLRAGSAEGLQSRVFNVGGPEVLPLGEIAGMFSRLADAPQPVYGPFPREASRIDIGNFFTDSTRIRYELEWKPKTSLLEGATRTLQFFREHLTDYLDPADDGYPECHLRPHALVDGLMNKASKSA